jgi:predicted PurR-regulated permease PerM
VWLFQQGETGWAIFMVVWGGLVISMVDNIIKPIIISRGSSLPFVLVFLGVLGGAVAFGLVGVFLGPTLLAVGYRLLNEWSNSLIEPEQETPSE